MIKKLATVIALIVMAHLSMSAAYSIVIHRDGVANEGVLLEERPVVTFNESDLLITTAGSVLAIPRVDITNIDFIDDWDGVALPETVENVVEMVDSNTLRVKTAGAPVAVYDLAGRVVASAKVAIDGDYTTVSLAACSSGVYIIAFSNKTYKLIKR